MRLKVPFLGYVLALVGFLLPSILFIAILPSLINAEPVKTRLMSELRDWTGSEIDIRGPISVESFFSLSVNVQNVEIKGFRGLPELKSLRAGEIVARIAWTNLLFGKLDFDKIKINDATALLQPMNDEQMGRAIGSMLTGPNHAPFATFVLTNCKLETESGEPRDLYIDTAIVHLRQSDRRIEFNGAFNWRGEDVSIGIRTYALLPDQNAAPVPLKVKVRSRLFTGQLNGNADLAAGTPWNASGEIQAGTPNAFDLSHWIGAAFAPLISEAASIAGTADIGRDHLNLQSASFSLADERADGDLNLTFDTAGPRVDGTLAFDAVDLQKLWTIGAAGEGADSAHTSGQTGLISNASVDLRVSANQMRWNSLVMQRSAFTLTGRGGGHFSAEIADLRLFDGSLLGHIAADFSGDGAQLRARLTAEDIDTSQLLAMAASQSWLSGRADINVEAEAAGHSVAELLGNAKASARVSLPDGGQVRLNLSQTTQSATTAGRAGWDTVGLDWSAFDDLRLELAFASGRLRFRDLRLTSAAASLGGSGEVDLNKQTVDWKLQVWPGSPDAAAATGVKPNDSSRTGASLSIQGPWAAPAIQFGRQSGEKTGRGGAATHPAFADRNL